MTTILVTGANGFLGQHLCLYLNKQPYKVIATGRGNCRIPFKDGLHYADVDLTKKEDVLALLQKHKPDVIIHTAALSKPDECALNKDLCLQVNVEATKHLLQLPVTHFIYTSTDFIFGENGPHAEDDDTGPLNFYGQSKLMAEKIVEQSKSPYTIIRPVFIYGEVWPGSRSTFLHWVKQNLEQKKKIKVVSDQQRTPTYVNDICKAIETVIKGNHTGVFHIAGRDILSPYQMALETATELGLDINLIESVTSATFPEPVKRARRSGLKIGKAEQVLNYNPVSFKEGVRLSFRLNS